MSHVIEKLKGDHRRIERVLGVFEREVERCRAEEDADIQLMHDAVMYCSEYVNRFHHPTEDHVFERLLRRFPETREDVDDLLDDHRHVVGETGMLLYTLDRIIAEGFVTRDAFCRLAESFLAHNRKHIEKEEDGLFRFAAENLDPEDWQEIQRLMPEYQDPLTSKRVRHHFRALYHSVSDTI